MMRPVCVVCGRKTKPFAFIGAEAVGPACAKKLGLSMRAIDGAKGGRIRKAEALTYTDSGRASRDTLTMDLFTEGQSNA